MKKVFMFFAAVLCAVISFADNKFDYENLYGVNYVFTPNTWEVASGEKSLSGDVTIQTILGHYPATYDPIINPVAPTYYSVTSIRAKAFYGCDKITSVSIPSSVRSIGEDAFTGCSALERITVESDNPNFTSIDGILYNKELTEIIHIPQAIKGAVTIPNTITSIEDEAFENCDNLTSITIPNSVTSIGERAFAGCWRLTNITIPNSVTSIGDFAFDCPNLTEINVYSDNPNYKSIDGILYNKDVTELIRCPIGKNKISIPNSVTSIGYYAFGLCYNLISVTIPNTVTSIGSWAFSHCDSLTSITIPNSVTRIGTGTFYNCERLTTVTIPNSVTYIDNSVFSNLYDNNSLTTIICKAKVPPSCYYGSFGKCYNATLYVPKGTAQAYRNAYEWKNFYNIVEMDMEDDDNTTAVKDVAGAGFAAYAVQGTVYCSAEEFQIFTIQGKNVTNQNGNLPAGVYVVVGEKGSTKVVVK